MQNVKLIRNMVPPALQGILYSGIKALRYGNLLPNKYRVTESGNDLVYVSISDLKYIKSKREDIPHFDRDEVTRWSSARGR